jgi:hypothetical protein
LGSRALLQRLASRPPDVRLCGRNLGDLGSSVLRSTPFPDFDARVHWSLEVNDDGELFTAQTSDLPHPESVGGSGPEGVRSAALAWRAALREAIGSGT